MWTHTHIHAHTHMASYWYAIFVFLLQSSSFHRGSNSTLGFRLCIKCCWLRRLPLPAPSLLYLLLHWLLLSLVTWFRGLQLLRLLRLLWDDGAKDSMPTISSCGKCRYSLYLPFSLSHTLRCNNNNWPKRTLEALTPKLNEASGIEFKVI